MIKSVYYQMQATVDAIQVAKAAASVPKSAATAGLSPAAAAAVHRHTDFDGVNPIAMTAAKARTTGIKACNCI